MRLAANLNGLTNGDVSPWHLKVSYTLYDENGQPASQGIYEEFWFGPTRFRRSITQGSFIQTDYGIGNGMVRSGSTDQASPYLQQMRFSLVLPFPTAQAIDQNDFQKSELSADGEKFICLDFSDMHLPNGLTYCLDSARPVLRRFISKGDSTEVDHSNIITFDGHFVAGDLKILRSNRVALTAHVDTLEPIDLKNPPDLTPPADAVAVHRRIQISAGVAVGLLEYNPAPVYPSDAKAAGISGNVVLSARIGIDGRIANLSVVQGPLELQQAAMDAVRTWRYRPYILNGEPVEVLTRINVVFTLGRRN